jgi:signal recognition particle subunit SEC65
VRTFRFMGAGHCALLLEKSNCVPVTGPNEVARAPGQLRKFACFLDHVDSSRFARKGRRITKRAVSSISEEKHRILSPQDGKCRCPTELRWREPTGRIVINYKRKPQFTSCCRVSYHVSCAYKRAPNGWFKLRA